MSHPPTGDTTLPIEVTILADPPAVQFALLAGYRMSQHLRALVDSMNEALAEAAEPIWTLLDIRQMQINWSDLVSALADIRDIRQATPHSDNSRGTLIITGSDLLKLGAKALSQSQYGGGAVGVFETVEEALDFARSQAES